MDKCLNTRIPLKQPGDYSAKFFSVHLWRPLLFMFQPFWCWHSKAAPVSLHSKVLNSERLDSTPGICRGHLFTESLLHFSTVLLNLGSDEPFKWTAIRILCCCFRFMLKIPVVRFYFAQERDVWGLHGFSPSIPTKANSINAALETNWMNRLPWTVSLDEQKGSFLFHGILTQDSFLEMQYLMNVNQEYNYIQSVFSVFFNLIWKKCTDSRSCVWENKLSIEAENLLLL